MRSLSKPSQGSVFARVSGAIYLRSDEGQVTWLIPMDAPMHRRALMVDADLPACKSGDRYRVADHTLVIDSATTLDFHQSMTWKAVSSSAKPASSPTSLVNTLHLLSDQLLAQSPPAGFGLLIEPILRLAKQKNVIDYESSANKIAVKAWTSVQRLILAGLKRDTDEIFLQAKALVGFGEGLTPSGDDFLGGFFYSLQTLRTDYPGAVNSSNCTYLDFIRSLQSFTNLISYTMLFDHAEGHSEEPVHQLTEGLWVGASMDVLYSHARRLISLGHSTGWDILTGFFAGMIVALA